MSAEIVAEGDSSWSLWSHDSFLSIASEGSVLSHLSVGGILAEQTRSEGRAVGASTVLASVALVGAARLVRRRLSS